jgi:hypothetical protein
MLLPVSSQMSTRKAKYGDRYRYTASNIMEWQSRFGLLREAIWDYTIKIKRQDGRLPFADALLASPADKDEKKP